RETYYYPINVRTEPQIANVEVSIIYENKTINREKVSFEIKPYSEFVIKEDTLKELFKETTDYVLVNDGNIRKKDSLIVKVGFFDRFFIQYSPEPTGRGNNYIKWDFELKPDEEGRVTVIFNYRPFFYVVLLILLSYLMYYLFRSPILLKKEALVMGSTKEGISELKVLIHVRNRSPELVEKLALTDLLPSITELGKDIHIGSITPTKILRNDKKGTLVKWELEALEPLEERIITYKLKTKIIIVGGLTLPRARIKFKTKDSERTVKSNKARIEKAIE
ncbi:MAG: hypothetical protein NDI94_06930, partial [Candidatus Woesearchaeota archaeon]|nr:hypothetical protein [Candidatus Woesearchaeota archaeon]